MWKLFQSVLKSFRSQTIVPPCQRISTATTQQESHNNNDDYDGNFEICCAGHPNKTSPVINQQCRCYDQSIAFPQIQPPSSLSVTSSQTTQTKPLKVVKFTLPQLTITTASELPAPAPTPPPLREQSEDVSVQRNEQQKQPTMGSLHDAMGLAALKSGDKEAGLQHLLIAADVFGSEKAQYNLGVLYQFELNNPQEAIKRYRLAKSHPSALYNLAFLTLNSPDTQILMPQAAREKEALKLLKQAANLGSKEAASFLLQFEREKIQQAELALQLEAGLLSSSNNHSIIPAA